MSTSPETDVVNLLSRWLAGHVTNDEVGRELAGIELPGEGGELLAELRAALPAGRQGDLERLVRETLEAVALGH
jgi:hypothetical protein